MSKWHNKTGKPLSSLEWLKTHHNAKLKERINFAKSILQEVRPKRIIDLGCANGLWLNVFNELIPDDCEFIGIDINKDSIDEAKNISKSWNRKVEFLNIDIAKDIDKIPKSDMILAFNIFSYINDSDDFLQKINMKLNKNGLFVIRQYDGGTMRFGPMSSENRNNMDDSLFNAVGDSNQFRHYDIDRIYTAINNSAFEKNKTYFETLQKHSPFSNEFYEYFNGTVEWTINYLNNIESKTLQEWHNKFHNQKGYYFLENYLVSLLSCGTSANSHKS